MNGTAATPVQTLREHASRLEAAISVALARPKPKAVHALRSESRRIEAQLELLSMVHNLPAYRGPAQKLLQRLKKLRSAAGKVRDCDVQRKLLKNGGAQLTAAPEAPRGIEKDGEKLRKALRQRRDRYEARLLSSIQRQQKKLSGDIESLLDALKPGEELQEEGPRLLAEIEQRFEHVANANAVGEEHLHEVRKTAKRARYQCESLPGDEAAAMAKQFEAMQDAGGSWHDLLELARRSHKRFGPEHPLSRVLEHRRDQHLDRYAALLEQFRVAHPAPERAKPQRAHHRNAADHRGTKAAKRTSAKKSGTGSARSRKGASSSVRRSATGTRNR